MQSLASFALLLSCICPSEAQGPIPKVTLSVCDLLQAPSKYNRKLIAVRGEYFEGGHGTYLRGECKVPLVTKGFRWPSMIYVSPSREETENHGMNYQHAVNAEVQIAIVRAREARLRGADPLTAKMTLTYVGLFETRDGFDREIGKVPDGKPRENGFGPGAAAPGQLFVDTVRDIVVTFDTVRKRE
jgi:hypothetical protein